MLLRSLAFLCLALLPQFAHASSEPLAENVMAEVMKDLSAPYTPQEKLAGKMCLNGASVDGFQGDIIEYWANIECPYCDIKEPLAAQQTNPNLCIVVRHSPSASYGESVKKSLVYETLMQLSPNAAHQFWSDLLPEKGKGVPVPYEAALQKALDSAAISTDSFVATLKNQAETVSKDIVEAQNLISTTPTYIMEGIRLPACDFTAKEIPSALALAKRIRSHKDDTIHELIEIIVKNITEDGTV